MKCLGDPGEMIESHLLLSASVAIFPSSIDGACGAVSAARTRKTRHLAVVLRRISLVVVANQQAAGKRNIR
jgi:hypothetical protein